MYTEHEGIRMQYESRGEGSPVLLLHGWLASMEAMQPIADAVVAMGMRAVLLDFPGFGGSDEPPAPFGVPDYARVTRAFIREQNLEGCDVICHSFGGRVTICLASEEATLFRRLVLVDAAGIRPKRGLKYYIRTTLYKVGKKLKRIAFLDRLLGLSKKQASAGSADYRALKSDTMRGTFVKVVNLDLTDRLARIKNPSLLIWGELDTETPLYMGRMMEKCIPDAGLVVLPGAGHFSYADQYPRFCAVLRAFLGTK